MRIGLLLLSLALAACMAVPASPTRAAAPGTNGANASALPVTLARYHWQLHDAVDGSGRRLDALFGEPDKPLQLDFTDGRVGVRNACNNMSGSYLIVEDHLQVVPMMQTMMACHDQTLMQRELTIKAMLRSRPMLALSMTGDTPQLTLADDNGHVLTFAGVATAETRYGGPGETVFLEVSPQAVPCGDLLTARESCLQVREIHYDAQGLRRGQPGPWQPLPWGIEGYAHQPGTRNVLRVKRYAPRQPAAANAPHTAYVLDMVVESGTVKASDAKTGNVPPSHP